MKIVYLSVTGQTRKFVDKLGMDSEEINLMNPFFTVGEPFVLVVPTYESDVTESIEDFLETGDNSDRCEGICGGGNRNFANLFLFAAKDLAVTYNLPYLHEFEFQGSDRDVEAVKQVISNIELGKATYLTPRQQGYTGPANGDYNQEDIRVVKHKLVEDGDE